MTARTLVVWWERRVAGTLTLDRHGAMRFAYDAAWLSDDATPPLSLSLPKRSQSFPSRRCAPFFEGLLPEGAERDAVARALGVSADNAFGILAGVGGEVAGAVSLWPDGQVPPGTGTEAVHRRVPAPGVAPAPELAPAPAAAQPLSDAGLIRLLETIKTRPYLANGKGGLRLSLAGAQSKLPVVAADGQIALPAPGEPTTHILKPANERFPAMTENEAFAMRLAQRMGVPAAPVEPRVANGRTFLLVERYDRAHTPDGSVRRLHQEDFCQALELAPRLKYASEGGPGFPQCFDLVRRACTRPETEARKLLDAAIYQVLVGNADAHGKNYSLVRRGPGFGNVVELAPLYDVLCTVAYPGLSPKLAMKIGGRAKLEEMRPADWDRFAQRCGLGSPVRHRVAALCETAAQHCGDVAGELALPGLDHAALHDMANRVRRRATRLAAVADEGRVQRAERSVQHADRSA